MSSNLSPCSSSCAQTPAKRRLSLAALCNPTPVPPTMAPGSSASRTDSPDHKPLSLSAEEESVMIAVCALDDMRSGAVPTTPSSSLSARRNSTPPHQTPALTAASTSSTPSTIPQSLSMSPEESAATADFVSRMSGLPIVNSALKAYEQSKASSRVVKYGAEMMESSVKSISKPVINRLPVNQLDEFACRQLDRFERYGSSRTSLGSRERSPSFEDGERSRSSDRHPNDGNKGESHSRGSFTADGREQSDIRSQADTDERALPAQDVASRSRWHSILYEASGISAAMSEDNMRRLKFCLQWLQYATDHIDGQILVLRNFIASLNAQEEDGAGERPVSVSHMQTLTNVKRDVVSTIRQVVDVVSKYAGGALPDPARARVRQFILSLPQRWANTSHRQAHGSSQAHLPGQGSGKRRWRDGSFVESGPASAASTAPSSPLQSPKTTAHGILPLPSVASGSSHRQTTASRPTAGSATQAAQRVMTLATESLDMMRSVTGVFRESLDRADTWVDRLRVVGIQRRQDSDNSLEDVPPSYRSHHVPSESASDNSTFSSGSATATFTSFPPSPRSWTSDAPSPGGQATASLDALALTSLSVSTSAFPTPRSSTQTLSALAGCDWDYTAQKLQTIRDADERKEGIEESEMREGDCEDDERSAASALSSLRGASNGSRGASMDVDGKD